jgi:cytochrome P450
MDDRQIADNLLTFITAGHETTALALTWPFYLLSLHPEIEERLVEEVERVTGGDLLSEAHIEHLALLRQVLQKTMRLYPPAPVVVRAATQDVSIGRRSAVSAEQNATIFRNEGKSAFRRFRPSC